MKLINFKTVALTLLASAMFVLSGCGSEGTPSDTQLVAGSAPLVRAPHDITTHVTNPVIVASHTIEPTDGTTHTHTWTQVSGDPVTIANGTTANAHVTPSTTGTVVVQHTVTHPTTGATTTTHHTIVVVAPPASIQAHVSYAVTVPGGYPSSIQVSVDGGTGPYSYDWVQTTGPVIALDTSTHGPQNPVLITPIVSVDTLIEYTLEVTDSTGLSTTNVISFTILAGAPAATPTPTTTSTPTIIIAAPTVIPPLNPSLTSTLLISLPPFITVHLPKATLDPLVHHVVDTGYIKITNGVPGETYTWSIQETTGVTPPLDVYEVQVNKYDSALAIIHIVLAADAAYTAYTTYTFKLLVVDGTGRSGTATLSLDVIPKVKI